jgi:hypothetical protein
VTTANARKGSETERMVAKYLREQGWPQADRRLREGRRDDQGDIDGVPLVTIQVKNVEANRYQEWVTDTLEQRENAGNPLCLLVRRVPRKPVEQWEALMPSSYFIASFDWNGGGAIPGQPQEAEAWTWMRMDLRLAVFALQRMTGRSGPWHPSSLTTSTDSTPTTPDPKTPSSVLSMEKDDPV